MEIINQILIAVPFTMAAIQVITTALSGIFNIEKGNTKHIITWVLGALFGAGLVGLNDFSFGVATWANYVIGIICGIGAAAASNGVYDWHKVANLLKALEELIKSLIHKKKE